MHFPIYNRVLLQGMMASAVVLAAASACSRSDRADAGRSDTTQDTQTGTAVTPADSQAVAATQPTATDTAAPSADAAGTSEMASKRSETPRSTPKAAAKVSGYQAMGHDTSTSAVTPGASADTTIRTDSVTVGDSAHIGKPGDRLDGAEAQQANADTAANQTESDRVRPPEDSSETIGAATTDTAQVAAVSSDSAVRGDSEMARDTSSVLAQADTTAQTQTDTVAETSADTAAMQARVDTTTTDQQTEVAVETPADTATVAEDSTETERIRPAEDSTEVLGQVTTDRADAAADTSAVGAAAVQSTGNIATGADAVALMTREGQRCAVVSDDRSRDLASSPATMNPCGTGTMTLPRVQSEEK